MALSTLYVNYSDRVYQLNVKLLARTHETSVATNLVSICIQCVSLYYVYVNNMEQYIRYYLEILTLN